MAVVLFTFIWIAAGVAAINAVAQILKAADSNDTLTTTIIPLSLNIAQFFLLMTLDYLVKAYGADRTVTINNALEEQQKDVKAELAAFDRRTADRLSLETAEQARNEAVARVIALANDRVAGAEKATAAAIARAELAESALANAVARIKEVEKERDAAIARAEATNTAVDRELPIPGTVIPAIDAGAAEPNAGAGFAIAVGKPPGLSATPGASLSPHYTGASGCWYSGKKKVYTLHYINAYCEVRPC